MTTTPHYLRLVGADSDPRDRAAEAARRVEHENRAAATNPELDPRDPRWVLAMRTYSQLQGAALTPERRARVMRTAQHLGLRPFDANLIIAVVQDHARRNESPGVAQDALRLIGRASPEPARAPWGRWLAAFLAALVAAALLIRWLGGS